MMGGIHSGAFYDLVLRSIHETLTCVIVVWELAFLGIDICWDGGFWDAWGDGGHGYGDGALRRGGVFDHAWYTAGWERLFGALLGCRDVVHSKQFVGPEYSRDNRLGVGGAPPVLLCCSSTASGDI